MCGIAGIHRRTDAPIPKLNRLASELLLAIENRGSHATGWLAVLDSGKVQMEKAPVPASRFVKGRKATNRNARTVLLHTRYATVGAREDKRNAHPVASGNVAAIHNGTIYNHEELFQTFGLRRRTSVDSEVIPALIDKAGWDQAEHALALMRGGAATAIVDVRRPKELLLARLRDYPLVYYVTKEVVVWASTREAIQRAWWNTYGRIPTGGRFYRVPEYRLLRVNGSIQGTDIDRPPGERRLRTITAPKATKRRKGKRARKREAALEQLRIRVAAVETRPLSLSTATPPTEPGLYWSDRDVLCEPEPWQEDIVRQIMRLEGISEEEARELVFG